MTGMIHYGPEISFGTSTAACLAASRKYLFTRSRPTCTESFHLHVPEAATLSNPGQARSTLKQVLMTIASLPAAELRASTKIPSNEQAIAQQASRF